MELKEKVLIISALLFFSLLAWGITIYQAQTMHSEMEISSFFAEASLFLAMWGMMMVAMMLPSVVPMVLFFSKISLNQRTQNLFFVPTWVFVSGYVAIWSLVGIAAYLGDLTVRSTLEQFPQFRSYRSVAGGLTFLLVGIYQWSAFKDLCLSHCRSPISFIMHEWREGYRGAFFMGAHHGIYCLGCCWGLMVTFLVVGIMNLAWMGTLTLIIFIEKISRYGETMSKVVGGLFVAIGIFMIFQQALF